MLEGITVSAAVCILLSMVVIVRQLRELHKLMNSRLDELLRTTRLLANMEGFKAGQEEHLAILKDSAESLCPKKKS